MDDQIEHIPARPLAPTIPQGSPSNALLVREGTAVFKAWLGSRQPNEHNIELSHNHRTSAGYLEQTVFRLSIWR